MATTTPEALPIVEADHAVFRLPTRLEWIEKTARHLSWRAHCCGVCDSERADRVMLALHEALTNSVVHGNLEISSALKEESDSAFGRAIVERLIEPAYASRQVEIRFDYDGKQCDIQITDQGPGFDTSRVEKVASNDPSDEALLAPSGRGIIIMRALMDNVAYRHGGRQVILSLKKSTDRAESRSSARLPCARPVRVVPLRSDGTPDFGAAYDAMARDVSEGGIALLQTTVPTADRLLLRLRETDPEDAYVVADVCHRTTVSDDVAHVGCRFIAAVNPDLPEPGGQVPAPVAALLADLGRAGSAERRIDERLAYTVPIRVRRGGDQAPLAAFGRDLSPGGISFVAPVPLPMSRVELLLPTANGAEPQAVAAHVVRCQKITAGFHDIGCRFI